MTRRHPATWWMLSLLLLLLLPVLAQAQARAWLDRDRIEWGETATLNIESDQAGVEPPDYAALAPDFEVSGHSSRRSEALVNGQRRTRSLFGVALTPRREGVLTIPALRIGGATTQPLSLTVLPAATAPARAGQPAFIEAEVDSRTPYVQQSVGYVLRLYYATPLVSGQLDQPPPEGASMQRIGSDVQYTREVAGRRYTVVERRFQIVAERSGDITVPGARFEGRGVGGFFDDMFGNTRRELRATSAPITMQVRAMPDGAPQPWLPLHALELRYLEAPDAVRAGEAATVVVEAIADGAAGTQLPPLQLRVGDNAQVFAEPPQVDETFDGGRLRSRIVQRFSVVPGRAGPLRVAGPRVAWWDVRSGVARVADLPELAWQVEAGPGMAAALPVPDDATSAVERTGAGAWPWIALAFALLWLATLAWLLLRRGPVPPWRRSGPTEASADAVVAPAPRIGARQFAQVVQTGDLGEVADALRHMLTPPASDVEALAMHLDDHAQRNAIALLQRARWGDGDAAAARQALREAFRAGPAIRVPARVAQDALPPLYPRR
ncbi:protein BatD [Luteimonas aestuarii]|uniref:Protein BatD n=1 Tax=Luteimonas aestuarii TaxID=453837 RepID=A0A4R5TR49_9GAMM|nr:BatD family protein [Luteimonas aestuarii]TDK23272.1 protein BatD [Luteimonas aestuarii]